MSKIIKVYHPEGKLHKSLVTKLLKEIKTVTQYNDKTEITFKDNISITLRKE